MFKIKCTRLLDESVMVRKRAIRICTILIEKNPFGNVTIQTVSKYVEITNTEIQKLSELNINNEFKKNYPEEGDNPPTCKLSKPRVL